MEFHYQLQVNLKRLATVRIAALMLNQPLVRSKIQKLYALSVQNKKHHSLMKRFSEWDLNDVIGASLEKLRYCSLSLVLFEELTIATKSMLLKLLNWIIYVAEINEYDEIKKVACTKRVIWTHYGSIDYRRTFESCWLGNPELTKRDVFKMACNYCFEDHIKAYWEPSSDNFESFPSTSLAFYWQAYLDGSLEACENELDLTRSQDLEFVILYRKGVPHIPIKIFMLILAVRQGHAAAVIYFWSTLDDEQKQFSMIALIISQYRVSQYWQRDRYTEICIFLWSQVSAQDLVEIHKNIITHSLKLNSFIEFVSRMISSILTLWPWQEFFIKINQKFWSLPQLWGVYDSVPVADVLDSVRKTRYDFTYQLSSTRRVILVRTIWPTIPKTIKLLCALEQYGKLICKLLVKKELESVELIVNDQDFNSIRNELILQIARKCLLREPAIRFQLIELLFNVISICDVEKRMIKKQLSIFDFIYDILDIDQVENFFVWQCDSPDEYSLARKRIDVMVYWKRMMQERHLTNATVFLEWYFDSSKCDIRTFKESLLDTTYPCDFVIDYWCTADEDDGLFYAVTRSTKFLYWLLECDEAVDDFIKKRLVNENFKISLKENGTEWQRSKFLTWCSLGTKSSRFSNYGLLLEDRNLSLDYFNRLT